MSKTGEPLPKLTKAQERTAARVTVAAIKQLHDERYALLLELRAAGWTMPQLARLLGCSKQRIDQLMRSRA